MIPFYLLLYLVYVELIIKLLLICNLWHSTWEMINWRSIPSYALAISAATEEAYFRLFPFCFFLSLSFDKKLGFADIEKRIILLIVVFGSSIIFARAHGEALGNFLIQGCGGILIFFIFLKYGGYAYIETQKESYLAKAFLIASLYHFLYNLIAIKIHA